MYWGSDLKSVGLYPRELTESHRSYWWELGSLEGTGDAGLLSSGGISLKPSSRGHPQRHSSPLTQSPPNFGPWRGVEERPKGSACHGAGILDTGAHVQVRGCQGWECPQVQRHAAIVSLPSPGSENKFLSPPCRVKSPSATYVGHCLMLTSFLLHYIFLNCFISKGIKSQGLGAL